MNTGKALKFLSILTLTSALAVTGCESDDDGGTGTLKVELWGEEFIEEGIGADEFADGWSVTFDRFLINLGNVRVAREGRDPAIDEPAFRVFDLAATTGPLVIAQAVVPAGDYGHAAYTIAPVTAAATSGNATQADIVRMAAAGWSILVEGTATKGERAVSFQWGVSTTTTYDPCHSEGAVADGGEAVVQITIHGDHLFYDSAVSDEPSLRFQDLANADADQDGQVTQAEMAAYGILALEHYGVGSLDIDNLWEYVSHMTTTLGHIDGEGHCETR